MPPRLVTPPARKHLRSPGISQKIQSVVFHLAWEAPVDQQMERKLQSDSDHTSRYIWQIYISHMELSPTAYVILGMVSREPRSGYEIKGLVDDTTRFFWAASYGQIYPELKRLSTAGLIEGVDAP